MRSSRRLLTSKYVKALSLTLITFAAIFLFVIPGRTATSPFIISEFRLRGPNGASDEFIEIYNNTDKDHVVKATDGSSGYGVFASDGVMRFFIPNDTIIPARGHYLGANSVAYSLSNYPAGNSTTAIADATWTTDIPDNSGIALFSSTNTPVLGNRRDAVGASSVVTCRLTTDRVVMPWRRPTESLALSFQTAPSFPRAATSSALTASLIRSPIIQQDPMSPLEQPPTQVNGGGFNSSMSVSLGSPLKAGASIDLRFLFGVQQQGKFGFCAVIETLPFTNSAVTCYSGSTRPGHRIVLNPA